MNHIPELSSSLFIFFRESSAPIGQGDLLQQRVCKELRLKTFESIMETADIELKQRLTRISVRIPFFLQVLVNRDLTLSPRTIYNLTL